MWWIMAFVAIYIIGLWQIITWVQVWFLALTKPGYEQFGNEPTLRKLGEVYADGPSSVSVKADPYGHGRVHQSIQNSLNESPSWRRV